MRNLIRFIHRFHFFILFLILEIISFSILVSNNNYHRSKYFTSSNYFTGYIYNSFNDAVSYLSLSQENESLMKENIHLKNSLKQNFVTDTLMIDSILSNKFEYISARVINNSVYQENNFLTLNIGGKDGISPEMAVVSADGVVGITRFVSDNFTTVISVLNKKLRISTKIDRNGFFGSLEWSGNDYTKAKFKEIPVHVHVEVGDTLVTSGYSAIFPEGVEIGVIESFTENSGDNFFDITVNLIVDYKMLSNVYIIRNALQEEQSYLEEQTIND